MDCLEEGTVLAFVGGQLQGAALAVVEEHLVGCPACTALVAVAAPIAPAGAAGGTRRLDAVTVGRYQLRRLLGRGAMGEVYAGYDPELDRKVAIKILRRDVPNADAHRARFMREAQAVARLHHPNVVGIYDVGAAGDRIFLAMELIEGETLGAWLSRRPRAVPEILRMFTLAGRGLQAAHQAGIIHRDFKPQNVMVGRDGSPRVTDFGLAATAEAGAADDAPLQPPLTAAGAILGTPHYMSPEQLRGQRADARADQFSFSVAVWEALHGALPFPAKTWDDLRSAVLDGKPRPGPLARRVPRHVQAALLRGLAVDRAGRFAAMTHLLEALSPRRPPAWRRVAAACGAALAVAATIAGALAARAHARRAAACDPAPKLAAIWGPAADSRRAVARAAFTAAAADVPDAPARFARVSASLDGAAQRWGTLWRETCEAAADQPPADDRVSELALACLERWRRELGALSRVLAAADAKVARRAMAGVAALSPPDGCRDPAVLRAMSSTDTATSTRLAPLFDRLLALRFEAAAGDDAQAVAPARALLADVRQAGDRALLAESLVVSARIQSPFEPDAALPLLESGYREAQALGLTAAAAEAAIQLALIHGAVQHRFVAADRWLGLTEVAIAHARGFDEPRLRSWFVDTRGVVAAARGQWRQARSDFAAAIADRELASGDAHPELGGSLIHLSRAAAMLDDAPAAVSAATRALDTLAALFPPDSYEVGAAHLARARALLVAGRADAAADAEAARAAFERALGRDHPFLVEPMTVRGEVALAHGDAATARDLLERAWEIRSTQLADAGAREETAFALARAIWLSSGDQAHALELAREARDGYGTLPDLAGRQAVVAGWIAGHPDRAARTARR
ncbi:MAG: serine/threonine-protein kinase [Polyangia bacterium]